jgi:hypothetical protein
MFASAAPVAALALMVVGMLTYAAARARLSKC